MSAADPGACPLRWCQEAMGHEGPHRKRLLDTFALDVQTGRPTIMQLWLQGESARVRALVLVTDTREVGMTWSQADDMAGVMASATRRFGP